MAAGRKRRRNRTNNQVATAPPQQQGRVAEIISRTGINTQLAIYNSRGVVSVDTTRTDYAFYDLLRRGKQPGYKLGALFAKRIEHILSVWVLGRGVTIKLAEGGSDEDADDARNTTDKLLRDFLDAEHAQLMTVKEDALGLGDQYIFVNPDGTVSVPSPDTVTTEYDPLDYRTVISRTITTKLPDGITITDKYTATERVMTIKKGAEEPIVERYAVLIGRIPCIHITHGKSGNEVYGHSIHEDLLKLYDQYDDVIHKQLDGVKLLGNPMLTISGLEDLSAVIDANKPATNSTYFDRNGNEVTRPELNIDINSLLLIGKGGKAEFVSPPVGFTADTQQALKTLFLLLLDRTGIPEFIWGNELSGSHATADTQMNQWAHDVEGQQRADEGWLLDLCEIWLATAALTDASVVVDELKAEWPPVIDENQDTRLKTLEYASTNNLLRAKTKLELTGLPVEDAGAEVEAASAEIPPEPDPQDATAAPVAQMNSGGYNRGAAVIRAAIREEAERMVVDG